MKSSISLALAAVAAALVITFSCQKSSHGDPDPNNPNNPVIEYVSAGISGRVVDDANQPVNAAAIKVGAATATTDIDGNFSITNVSLNKNAGLVKVEKDGFFPGSRTIVVNAGAINNVTIQLIPKKVAGTVNATGGGNVTVPSGGTIAFTGNSFTNTGNNSAYTGTVSVSAFFLNPEAANFKEIMPGALRGVNAANEETGLQSFGMMAVELNGAGGEKLQLAAGKTATLTFPIAAGLLAQAPNTIPLWSFNDSSGLWKEEGTATKQGSNYVGTVGHFSFWNCDYPYGVVDFKAIIKDQNGSPLYPAQVVLKVSTDTFTYGSGYTDNTGFVGGKIPINKALVMNVYNKCNTLLYTKNIGPFSATADLGTVTVSNTGASSLQINGSLINCNALAVTNGFVDIFLDNVHSRVMVDSKGNFNFAFSRCNSTPATAVLTAYDLATNQIGASTSLQVSTGTANAGQLTACGNTIAEFANFTLNSVPYNFTLPADSMSLNKSGSTYSLWTTHKNSNAKDYSYIGFVASATGTAQLSSVYINTGTGGYYSTGTSTLSITEFGTVGTGYIAGNFSATLKDTITQQTAPVNYTFRVKRTQ